MYAVLGYLLANTELSKRTRLWIYAAGAACFLLRYGYTLAASTAQGTLVTTLFDYMYFTAAIPAVAVFIWFKYHDWQRKPNLQKYAKGIAAVSSCSFGIYLIHRIVLVEGVFNNLGIAPNSILLRTVGPFVVYFLCLGIVYLIKKIPGLKILVP